MIPLKRPARPAYNGETDDGERVERDATVIAADFGVRCRGMDGGAADWVGTGPK